MAKKYHPDLAKGNENKFKEINEAYSILSDPQKRREYDATRNIRSYTNNNNGGYGTQQGYRYGGNTYNQYQGFQQGYY